MGDLRKDGNSGKCEGESAGTQETNPDLLKNTPSNIARLEDVIEHCKGRQKYLAQTRSSSDGSDVRWYFCKVPLLENELAASIPRTEIVGKSDYFRFAMRDSLAIEASFLQREEEFLSCWWKEYAECSEGPAGSSSINKIDAQSNSSSPEGAQSVKVDEDEEERVGVPVKGGLYEVDLAKRHCFPVYWNGENRRVLRGHWFARKGGLDWLPLREDVSEQLEIAYRSQVWHRRRFQPSGLYAARVDLQGCQGLHALFTGEDDTWEAWLNVDASGFSSILSFRNGIKLRRGYSPSLTAKPTQDELRQQREEQMDDYCSQVPVRHLVFMVHGIGQRLEKSNLVDDVGTYRHITASLAERHLSSHQLGTQRVLFIPCQWRKGLKLSGETAVEKITLDGVRGLRVMLSATVHDVLYYMSPIYCQDIINSVSNQLNRLYLKFLKRNPGYDGKVSLYGHSLGSVLSYDILCHQVNLSSPFPMNWMYEDPARTEESYPEVNNQSSIIGGTNHMEISKYKKMSMKPTSLAYEEEYAEDMDFVTSMVGDTERTVESTQLSRCEDTHEVEFNSNDMLPENEAGSDEATYMNCEEPICGLKKMPEPEDISDKDNTIRLMRNEIDFLTERVAELELKCGGNESSAGFLQEAGNMKVQATMPTESTCQTHSPIEEDAPKSYTPYIKYTKLEFKVDTFFAVGSPLGVFLSLRNIRLGIGKGQEYWGEENIIEEMPACRQMFNIFHPFDPVAYRIEPLVCKEYISKRPVIIPYHKGGRRLHIGFQEFTEDLAARSQAIMVHLNSVKVKVLTVCQSRNANSLEEEEGDDEEKQERSYGSIMIQQLSGSEGRIDHMLQDKTFDHPYLQAIGAHTNYWRDHDTALFILKHLYRDMPEDPNSFPEKTGDEIGSAGWSDDNGMVEEQTPLTFSDSKIGRSLSTKGKRFLKSA